jgi:hypothetical protein
LGLGFASLPILVFLQARLAARFCNEVQCAPDWRWWQSLDWFTVAVGALSMIAGGGIASFIRPAGMSFPLRVGQLILVAVFVAFPMASLIFVLVAPAEPLGIIVFLPVLFFFALIGGVIQFGAWALAVTIPWALVCAAIERRDQAAR